MKALRPAVPNFSADSLVCVVDDDELICRSLVRLFRSVGVSSESFGSAEAFLKRESTNGPCCVVLDLQMPGLNGLELQQRLAGRSVQIVFMTGHGDVPTCARAMKAGAVDFLTKPVEDDDLVRVVSSALERSAESRKAAEESESALSRRRTLTARELEVMRHVIAGLLNKQIADVLGAAEKTIKIHRGRVMEKMGVTSVADLVRVAQAAGIAPVALEESRW
jgi:FixJ family two-component response regulator